MKKITLAPIFISLRKLYLLFKIDFHIVNIYFFKSYYNNFLSFVSNSKFKNLIISTFEFRTIGLALKNLLFGSVIYNKNVNIKEFFENVSRH